MPGRLSFCIVSRKVENTLLIGREKGREVRMCKTVLLRGLVLFSLVWSLTACGGGGGGGAASAPDVTPPTVSSTTPASSGAGVEVTSAIRIVFSEAMNPATITSGTITVSSGVTGTVGYDPASRTATFTPASLFANNTSYTVTVATGVRDAAGNALAAPHSWNFTTVSLSRQFGTAPDDSTSASALDGSGNLYVVGTTGGALDGQARVGGTTDGFIAKYDPTGVRLWTRLFGTTADETVTGVAVDATGNVYVTGFTSGSFPGFTRQGTFDAFLAKYDSAGAQQWLRQFGTSGNDFAAQVVVNEANVYVAGDTTGDFPGAASPALSDGFLARYDGNGALQVPVSQFSPGADVTVTAAALDSSSGNIVVAGDVSAGGQTDIFVQTLSGADGTPVVGTAVTFGTVASDEAKAVAVDGSGTIFVSGGTQGAFVGVNQGSWDVFLTSIVGGAPQQTIQEGTAGFEYGTGLLVSGGTVYLAGFSDSVAGSLVFARTYNAVTLAAIGAGQFGTGGADRSFGLALDAARNRLYLPGQTSGTLEGFTPAGGLDAIFFVFGTDLVKR